MLRDILRMPDGEDEGGGGIVPPCPPNCGAAAYAIAGQCDLLEPGPWDDLSVAEQGCWDTFANKFLAHHGKKVKK